MSSHNILKDWKSIKKQITNINIIELINLYGNPEIDSIHARKIIDNNYYNEAIKNNRLDATYKTQPFYYFIQPYIHWNIVDKNKQLESIIHIEFYQVHVSTRNKYPQKDDDWDYFLSHDLINDCNYEKHKNQLIYDFIHFQELSPVNYPNLNSLAEMSFSLEYLHSECTHWYINSKNINIYNELSSILEFNEVKYSDDSD